MQCALILSALTLSYTCYPLSGIILKWVGAVVNTVDKEVLAPHLPSLVAPVHREVKNTTG